MRADGVTFRGELLTVAFLSAAEERRVRAGFITSKRVGGAVQRNRARRRLREIFRKYQHEISAGTWIVMIASSRAARASFQELEADWLRLVQRASILRG